MDVGYGTVFCEQCGTMKYERDKPWWYSYQNSFSGDELKKVAFCGRWCLDKFVKGNYEYMTGPYSLVPIHSPCRHIQVSMKIWRRCVVCGRLTKEILDYDVFSKNGEIIRKIVPICNSGPKNRAGDNPCKWAYVTAHLMPVEEFNSDNDIEWIDLTDE